MRNHAKGTVHNLGFAHNRFILKSSCTIKGSCTHRLCTRIVYGSEFSINCARFLCTVFDPKIDTVEENEFSTTHNCSYTSKKPFKP